MFTKYVKGKEIPLFGAFCPFCGLPMQFLEEQTSTVKECPMCNAPIAFEEYMDFEKNNMGYNIIPNFSGESFEVNDFVVKSGMLTEYKGNATEIVTPENIVAIDKDVFKDNKYIKSVTITSNVKYIGHQAFYRCESLRKLVLSEGIIAIGNSAFAKCRKLEQVTIPNSLTAAGYCIFHTCENLKELLMPMDMKYLGGSPYGFCKKLKTANIPHCVITPGCSWFQENDAIEVLTIGRQTMSMHFRADSLREAYFHNPNGWRTFTYVGEGTPISSDELKNPKKAALALKRHSPIFIPDAPCGWHWFDLSE